MHNVWMCTYESTRNKTEFCSGKALALYSGGSHSQFDSRQETEYPVWDSALISSVPPGNFWDGCLNYATIASFRILFNSLFIDHRTIRRYTA
jgi:hypothetical protein